MLIVSFSQEVEIEVIRWLDLYSWVGALLDNPFSSCDLAELILMFVNYGKAQFFVCRFLHFTRVK